MTINELESILSTIKMKMAIRFDACAACDEVLETGFRYCLFIKCLKKASGNPGSLAFLFINRSFPFKYRETVVHVIIVGCPNVVEGKPI